MPKETKWITIDPDGSIKEMYYDKVIYKSTQYGESKFYRLLTEMLTVKQFSEWVGGDKYDFKIAIEKYDLILKEGNNNG